MRTSPGVPTRLCRSPMRGRRHALARPRRVLRARTTARTEKAAASSNAQAAEPALVSRPTPAASCRAATSMGVDAWASVDAKTSTSRRAAFARSATGMTASGAAVASLQAARRSRARRVWSSRDACHCSMQVRWTRAQPMRVHCPTRAVTRGQPMRALHRSAPRGEAAIQPTSARAPQAAFALGRYQSRLVGYRHRFAAPRERCARLRRTVSLG